MSRESDEVHRVFLTNGNEHREATLRYWVQSSTNDRYKIELYGCGEPLVTAGPDLFEALTRLREKIEREGWLIAVNGARVDTYPSGMARDMIGGEYVYVLRKGEIADIHSQLETLGPAEFDKLGTVKEQNDYYKSYCMSLHEKHENYPEKTRKKPPFGFSV